MAPFYHCVDDIQNSSKTSLLCSGRWLSQDVTAGCGDHCALQWHPVHSHQQHRSLQRPVTLPLTTCSRVEVSGWGSGGRGAKQVMTTPAHNLCLCCHPVTVFMGHKMIAGNFSDGQVHIICRWAAEVVGVAGSRVIACAGAKKCFVACRLNMSQEEKLRGAWRWGQNSSPGSPFKAGQKLKLKLALLQAVALSTISQVSAHSHCSESIFLNRQAFILHARPLDATWLAAGKVSSQPVKG